MPWTATTCDNLKHAISSGDRFIEFSSPTGTDDLCALIGNPPIRHVVLELYTAAGNEVVHAYACEGGRVKISRAHGCSVAKDWPAGTCVRTVQIIDGPMCGAEEDCDPNCSKCDDSSVWDGLTVCPELTVDTTTPGEPRLCLTPSGVAAGDYCGMRVDTYGRITYLPPTFPASCIPAYDPCCPPDSGGGGSGGPVDAGDVTYTPQFGGCLIGSTSVLGALHQLETAVCNLQSSAGNIGVASLTLCPSLVNTGTATNPNICLAPTGVTPGTYEGFTVNQYGQVTAYVPPVAPTNLVVGSGAITVTYSGGQYTVGAVYASETQAGVVQLVSPADVANNTVPVTPDLAVSWTALQQWWTGVSGQASCSTPFIPPLTPAQKATAGFIVCDGAVQHRISPADLATTIAPDLPVNSNTARARVAGSGAIIQATNVTSVVKTGTGLYAVTPSFPPGTDFVAVVTLNDPSATTQTPHVTYSPGAFTVHIDVDCPFSFIAIPI